MGSPSIAFWLLLAFMAFSTSPMSRLCCAGDPTDGFTPVPLTNGNLKLEWPYDVPLEKRYSYIDGIHRMWVFSTDKPSQRGRPTHPRTEIRITGYDYSSGVWQFEGYMFVPNGTTGASVMQIHRKIDEHPATTLLLIVLDGGLRFYSGSLVESDVYNRWMRLNVIHDADSNMLAVFIGGVQKLEVEGNGGSGFFFKCGVYVQHDESFLVESWWKNIKVYKKYN